jgi:hypothetical protein
MAFHPLCGTLDKLSLLPRNVLALAAEELLELIDAKLQTVGLLKSDAFSKRDNAPSRARPSRTCYELRLRQLTRPEHRLRIIAKQVAYAVAYRLALRSRRGNHRVR